MGVSGAATATVLSQTASCAFVLKTLFGKTVPVRITFGGYDWRLIRRILTIGFTPVSYTHLTSIPWSASIMIFIFGPVASLTRFNLRISRSISGLPTLILTCLLYTSHFAMVFIFANAIGAFTPPMGTLMFVTCGVTKCSTKDQKAAE